jgi:3-hydroxymyristoyl/3-hydroxydecanoyl-(acyl carrier protein) dehydratase
MRYRFLDRVPAIDAEAGTIRTIKNFPRTADYYDGTFRGEGEVPGSLILETVAATGSFLLVVRSGYTALGLLLKVSRAQFVRPLWAGERLRTDACITGIQGDLGAIVAPEFPIAEVHASADSESGAVVTSVMLFACLPLPLIFGERHQSVLDDSLELLGLRDVRP